MRSTGVYVGLAGCLPDVLRSIARFPCKSTEEIRRSACPEPAVRCEKTGFLGDRPRSIMQPLSPRQHRQPPVTFLQLFLHSGVLIRRGSGTQSAETAGGSTAATGGVPRGSRVMKNLGRFIQVSFLAALLVATRGNAFRGSPGHNGVCGSVNRLSPEPGTSSPRRSVGALRTASRSSGTCCPFGIHDRISFASAARHGRLG